MYQPNVTVIWDQYGFVNFGCRTTDGPFSSLCCQACGIGPILGAYSNDASWFVSSATYASEEASSRWSGSRGVCLGGHHIFFSFHSSPSMPTVVMAVMMMLDVHILTVYICVLGGGISLSKTWVYAKAHSQSTYILCVFHLSLARDYRLMLIHMVLCCCCCCCCYCWPHGYSYNAFQWTILQGSKVFVWCHSGQWSGIRHIVLFWSMKWDQNVWNGY